MPLRVALCITELEIGGAERALVELACRLDRARFAPRVYSLGARPAGIGQWLAAELEAAEIPVEYLDARTALDLPRTVERLTQKFRQFRPDVVQTFLFHANIVGAWAARRAGVPHVAGGIRVAEHRVRWHRWVARHAARWTDCQVCVSRAVAEFSARVTGIDARRLCVIPNGVDVARFERAAPADLTELGVRSGQRVFCCIGRLDRQKGIDWLFDLLPPVFARQSSHDLLIAGTGPEAGALERQAQRLGIASRVVFAGLRAEIPAILAASEALVLPSRWEGMPNSLLEAMAAGRPVVATDVEGVGEALGADSDSQLVAAGDSQAFAHKLLALLVQPQEGSRLGAANRDWVREHCSIETTVGAYERLFESLVTGGGFASYAPSTACG